MAGPGAGNEQEYFWYVSEAIWLSVFQPTTPRKKKPGIWRLPHMLPFLRGIPR